MERFLNECRSLDLKTQANVLALLPHPVIELDVGLSCCNSTVWGGEGGGVSVFWGWSDAGSPG